MMTFLLVLGVFLLGIILAAAIWIATELRRQSARPQVLPESLTMLQTQVGQLQREVGERMTQTTQAMQQQFATSTHVVRDVTEKLTRMEETAKQVLDVTAQLQSLQDILKNPKQRGILGEYYLESLLKNVMPPDSYQMQYPFKNGDIVDAAVFIKEKIVPIDSKFSLENYNRLVAEQAPEERTRLEKQFVADLKTRILETKKYIRPEEGTMDFAFMFIPHEAIYYDLLINKIGAIEEDTESLIQRAAGKYHVIIVSPTSFLAYLQTVMQGLRALKIEEQAKEIRKRVDELGKHLLGYEQHFMSVGKNLSTVVNQYNLASKEFGKIDKDVLHITGTSHGYETVLLDKPVLDE